MDAKSERQHSEAPGINSPLIVLMDLARRARRAESANTLQFLLVNQTMALVRYTSAMLWVQDEGVVLQSSVSHVDRHSPYILWVNRLAKALTAQPEICVVNSEMLTPDLVNTWAEWMPAQVLWVPITMPEGRAGLLLTRNMPFAEGELALLNEWSDIWKHAWVKLAAPTTQGELAKFIRWLHDHVPSPKALVLGLWRILCGISSYLRHPSKLIQTITQLLRALGQQISSLFALAKKEGWRAVLQAIVQGAWKNKRRRWHWIAAVLILFPVHLSVLVPSELVPANPAIIRVPIEGVVDTFFVAPNDKVVKGESLFKLDVTSLLSRAQVAEQEIQVATQEYRQGSLQSLSDAKSRGLLATQEGKVAERKIEADYTRAMLDKATIKSPRGGIVLFDEPTEWIGKPVMAGEKVMIVATEGQVEIEAWIPVGDMMDVPKAALVKLYLNAQPFSPVSGTVRYVAHEPTLRPDGTYAYRVRASLPAGKQGPRIGLKGIAKVSGELVPLSYWVLRKPLAFIRQFLGI